MHRHRCCARELLPLWPFFFRLSGKISISTFISRCRLPCTKVVMKPLFTRQMTSPEQKKQFWKSFRFLELPPLSLFPACLIPSLLPIRPFPVLFFLQKEFRNSFPKTSMPSHLIIGLQANALHRSQKKTAGKESPSSVIQTISAAAGSFLPESGRLSGAAKKKYRYFLLISALPPQRPSALSRRKLPSTVS